MANPNPSPSTRFKPGQSGNPGGKSEGQRAAEIETARISAEIRLKMVSSLQEKLEGGLDAADIIAGDVLKLLKDSEDRAHGTPKQSVDNTSSDGSMTPKPAVIELVAKKVDDDSAD